MPDKIRKQNLSGRDCYIFMKINSYVLCIFGEQVLEGNGEATKKRWSSSVNILMCSFS